MKKSGRGIFTPWGVQGSEGAGAAGLHVDWEKDGSGAEFGEVEGKPSLITVEFLQRGEGTELVLTHSRFATAESGIITLRVGAEGWKVLRSMWRDSPEVTRLFLALWNKRKTSPTHQIVYD